MRSLGDEHCLGRLSVAHRAEIVLLQGFPRKVRGRPAQNAGFPAQTTTV